MKIYRNVYLKSHLPRFTGREIIYYYGKVVTNADSNSRLRTEFDRSQDIYLGCDCDAPKYSAIIKKNKEEKTKNNQKREIQSYGKKCKIC